MAFTKRTIMLLCFIMAASMGLSTAAVYDVGDSKGWIVGNVDYNDWASSKNFQVNDILSFNYNNKYHNVMQVSSQEYYTCTVTNPIATLNTGKDSFTLSAPGDYYYLCAIPGHCQIGQKVHIKVDGSQAKSVQGNAYLSEASVVSSLSFLWFSVMGMLGICFF
ncbi:PREDICTED: mavicyanin-like [Nicotiana attenuata]|uniref:mavicyanin-like n=1 Tax=Nicotiana attenuata TaxID=49451 RepID=UPI000905D510|nr:PREDICTED: mavicyanin-like [Nicotiana attenuata]